MKVLLVNGSPHQHGCTDMALQQTAKVLEQQGIHTEIFWVGAKPISGCIGCGACRKGLGRCCVEDSVNQFTALAAEADGFIFGSPVHYAAISGAMTSFMDRAFYSGGSVLAGKPAAAVVSCRRGGASAAFDQMNKYFTISSMPVVSSQYWNQVHGSTPEQVLQDAEGIQTLQTLARNMAWLLKCIEAGKAAGIERPAQEPVIRTNFIR
ncbi:MAG: flavodoxin family protein [Oscillospiraceae bacterium]